MTPHRVLAGHLAAVRRRLMLEAAAIGLPLVVAATTLTWRLAGPVWATAAALVALTVLGLAAWRRAQAFDRAWLVAQLDARLPRFEDSSDLLFQDPHGLHGFARLQRQRLESRIGEAEALDLRPHWSKGRIAGAWAIGAAGIAAALLWPSSEAAREQTGTSAAQEAAPGATRITGARLRIVPPAYTGLPAREVEGLDAQAPAGSRADWIIGLSPAPAQAAVVLSEGARTGLSRDGDRWTGSRIIDQSILYRIEAPGLARQRLHRIDAVADAPPDVRVISPDSQLVLLAPGQREWSPVFEASDDYGVAATATLRITVTQGQGENITHQERTLTLRGQGDARRKRYTTTLNLAREGLIAPGDLIVQLTVRDNRAPASQETEGPSVILRWSPDLGLADGLEGLLTPALTAYFASQRQIIIDAEALIAERGQAEPRAFMTRSNAIGEDQARLRLRYGQFMGDEAEGGGMTLPTNDAPPLPTNDGAAPSGETHADDHADHDHDAEDHAPDDGHDHGPEPGAARPGSASDVMQAFGHLHDQGDAATLFDPGTRSTLRLAIDAMWGSERALRQGRPEEALPFAYEALEHLQTVRRADRIFLPRTGPDLPPVDMSRRLTGDRADIDPVLPGAGGGERDPALTEAWRWLQAPASEGDGARLVALERWVRNNRSRLSDPLGLLAAIDTVRNEPACADCRQTLRGLLWRAIEPPPAQVRRREAPGRRGQRYLDELR